MDITVEQVLAALRHVEEPDLKKDLVTLNMIRDVRIEGNTVSFTVVLTTPACPLKEMIHNACVTAIHLMLDKGLNVEVNMTAQVTTSPTKGLPGIKNIIAVGSGKGGVGKSTVAANLAVGLAASGSKVGLLDADIYGPSVPIMFDLQNERPFLRQVEGRDRMLPFERYGVKLMSIGFLVEANQPVVWRGPMASKAMNQLIGDTIWDDIDYLIVDLPPGTGDIHITIAQQFPLSGAVIVTTPQAVAVADARKAAAMFTSSHIQVPILGVVENMAFFSPPQHPDEKYYIFGKGGGATLAAEFQVPLLGSIPVVEAVRESGDLGTPFVFSHQDPLGLLFNQIAKAVAQQISIRNNQLVPTIS